MSRVWGLMLRRSRHPHRALPALPAPDAFHAMTQKERARVDRFGGTFCLVAFDVGSTDAGARRVELLSAALHLRKRLMDEVGWSDDRHLAVLLPGTTAPEARRFAEEISRAIAKSCTPPPYEVSQYPPASLRWDADPDAPSSEEIRPVASPDTNASAGARFTMRGAASGFEIPPWLGQRQPGWKRGFDVLVSGAAAVCLLPFLLLIALLIRIVSPGPVLFAQERVGYLGRKFKLWKFRTMRLHADSSVHRDQVTREMQSEDPLTKLDSFRDPRVIPCGRWLRLTGLDELPQLFNILRGDMSVIGPRPDPVYAADQYQPWHAARLDVLPGVTGLWQVSGKNRTTFKQMIRLDIAYARRLSPWLDLKILLKTPLAIVGQIRDGVGSGRESVQKPSSGWEQQLPSIRG